MRALSLLLVLTLATPGPLYAGESWEDESQAFLRGEPADRAGQARYALDTVTLHNLQTQRLVIDPLQSLAPSWMAHDRIKWHLSHPLKDANEIHRRQTAIRSIAENDKLFQVLERMFEKPRSGETPYSWVEQQSWWNQSFLTAASSLPLFGPLVYKHLAGSSAPPVDLWMGVVSVLTFGGFLFLVHAIASSGLRESRMRARQIERARSFTDIEFVSSLVDGCDQHCVDRINRWGWLVSRVAVYPIGLTGLGGLANLPARIHGYRHRRKILQMISNVVELETLYTYAKYLRLNKGIMPRAVGDGEPRIRIGGAKAILDLHPEAGGKLGLFIEPKTPEDVRFLQTIGNYLILAQAGLPVPVEMEFTPVQVFAHLGLFDESMTDSTLFDQGAAIASIQNHMNHRPTPTLALLSGQLPDSVVEDFESRPGLLAMVSDPSRREPSAKREGCFTFRNPVSAQPEGDAQ